jgi:hypothetical protein
MYEHRSEDADQRLIEALIFAPRDLSLETIERGSGSSADFKIVYKADTVAFCELKSPRDDWLDEKINRTKTSGVVGGLRDDSTFNRIRRHSNKASKQFESLNPNRLLPNILVFVNYDKGSGFHDLRETFTGIFYAKDGSRHITMPNIASSLERAKRNIDLCIWINGNEKLIEGYFFNENAVPNYLPILCTMFQLNSNDIRR